MIAGAVKSFRFSLGYLVNEISYANLLLLSASLPTYHSQEERDKIKSSQKGKGRSQMREDESINGDDPANKERIKQIFKEFR